MKKGELYKDSKKRKGESTYRKSTYRKSIYRKSTYRMSIYRMSTYRKPSQQQKNVQNRGRTGAIYNGLRQNARRQAKAMGLLALGRYNICIFGAFENMLLCVALEVEQEIQKRIESTYNVVPHGKKCLFSKYTLTLHYTAHASLQIILT